MTDQAQTTETQPEDIQAERLAAVARQIDAGHIPAGVQMTTTGGQVINGPADWTPDWDYVPDTEPGQAERDYDQREIATVRAEMEAEEQAEYEAEQRGEFDQRTEADAVAAHDAEYEELIERYESGQPARSGLEQAEYDHLAACADEPEEEALAEAEAEAGA